MSVQLKAVIFDIGRVLVHYDQAQTIAGLESVCALPQAALAALHNRYSHDLGIGALNAADWHHTLIAEAQAVAGFDEFLAAYCAGMRRNDEALAYALALAGRPGVAVAALSNTNEAHVRWLDAHAPELRRLQACLFSNEVGLLKPDPAIYRLALDRLGVAPAQALFVDDLAANVAAAHALGLSGVVHTDWAITRPAIEAWLARGA